MTSTRTFPSDRRSTRSLTTTPLTSTRKYANGSRSIRAGPSTSRQPRHHGSMPSKAFFAKLTNRRLKRGVFRSVADLEDAINRFVAETNADPKPFVWTARPNRILAAVKRGKEKLESIH